MPAESARAESKTVRTLAVTRSDQTGICQPAHQGISLINDTHIGAQV